MDAQALSRVVVKPVAQRSDVALRSNKSAASVNALLLAWSLAWLSKRSFPSECKFSLTLQPSVRFHSTLTTLFIILCCRYLLLGVVRSTSYCPAFQVAEAYPHPRPPPPMSTLPLQLAPYAIHPLLPSRSRTKRQTTWTPPSAHNLQCSSIFKTISQRLAHLGTRLPSPVVFQALIHLELVFRISQTSAIALYSSTRRDR